MFNFSDPFDTRAGCQDCHFGTCARPKHCDYDESNRQERINRVSRQNGLTMDTRNTRCSDCLNGLCKHKWQRSAEVNSEGYHKVTSKALRLGRKN